MTDWNALAKGSIVENRAPAQGIKPVWQGEIPPVIAKIRDTLTTNPHKKVRLPCTTAETNTDIRLAITCAFRGSDWRPTVRDGFDDKGNLVEVGITVSPKKGV